MAEESDTTVLTLRTGGLDDARVHDMIRMHVARAAAETAPGSNHALDISALSGPGLEFWTVWRGDMPVGMGALKRYGDGQGEVKSMYVAPEARGLGAGAMILANVIAAARGHGLTRLNLETGSWDYFAPAWALYRRFGFGECPPFGDYVPDPNSLFFTLPL